MKHYLITETEVTYKEYDTFDKYIIKADIVQYLSENKQGLITHEKECYNSFNDILGIYENNNKAVPCRVIQKGNRDFYRPLT